MTANPRLGLVVFDAPDIRRLATFYADLTGWSVHTQDDDWITVQAPDGREVAFQLAPDHVRPQWPGQEHPQQLHLDLSIDDVDAAADRAVVLGATRLGGQDVPDGPRWITLADPAGHPFDLCRKEGVGPVMALATITFDAPDALALATFYQDLLGLRREYEGAEGISLTDGTNAFWIQQVQGYNPPQWPDPAHPQQGHLDIAVEELAAGRERVLGLGATDLKLDGESFWVFADPAGHPFCLTTTD